MKSIIFTLKFICKIILAYTLGLLLVGVIVILIGIFLGIIPLVIASKLHPILSVLYCLFVFGVIGQLIPDDF
jgi:hypothetical protein